MEWVTIIAIVLGPILAVQIQQFLQKWKEKRDQQQHVFSTLMATRANTLAFDHVNALNWIDLAFSKKKKSEKDIVEAWEKLLDHYNNGYPMTTESEDLDAQEVNNLQIMANERSLELRVCLIKKMSDYLGYDFSETHIKNGCYSPNGHYEIENDQWMLRKAVLALFSQRASIPMNIVDWPGTETDPRVLESIATSEKNQDIVIKLLKKIANDRDTKIINAETLNK